MKLFNLFFNLKKKSIEPKAYTFLFEGYGWSSLTCGGNYTYEEALEEAQKEFVLFLTQKGVKDIDPHKLKHIHTSATVMELFGDFLKEDVQKVEKEENKNKIMAEILQKKDKSLIQKHSKVLSEKDKKYLEEKIDGTTKES